MTAPLNKHCFTEPHWRVIAGGFDTDEWFEEGRGVGTGGIFNPQPTHLPTGQYYYRFASSTSAPEKQLGGDWWLDFDNFRQIRVFAEEHGYSIRDAARLMLALPYAWTPVDLLIRALLKQPLMAYTGEGKPAQSDQTPIDRRAPWTPTQHSKIRQLYIPGLRIQTAASAPKPLYQIAFVCPPEVTHL